MRIILLLVLTVSATGCVIWETLTAPDARSNECVVIAGAIPDSVARAWSDSTNVAQNGICRF